MRRPSILPLHIADQTRLPARILELAAGSVEVCMDILELAAGSVGVCMEEPWVQPRLAEVFEDKAAATILQPRASLQGVEAAIGARPNSLAWTLTDEHPCFHSGDHFSC